ncbi:DUF4240 domain-containing protein [Kitasatospora sp. NPDC054939]
MRIDAFWTLIETSRRHAALPDDRLDWLRQELREQRPADLVAFHGWLEETTDRAYSWELWAAADRIMGGYCSDDGFCYFRLWLVGCGRAAYEAALADPDSLAELPGIRQLVGRPMSSWCESVEWPEWEELDYLAQEVHDGLTGADDEGDAFYDAVDDWHPDGSPMPDADPTGERWDVRDPAEAARRLPRLTALFPAAATR